MKKSILTEMVVALSIVTMLASPVLAQAQDSTSVASSITQSKLAYDQAQAKIFEIDSTRLTADHLNETKLYISIKQYSKYCTTLKDGKIDWALAIQTAINDLATIGGTLYLPSGAYFISDTIQLKNKVRLLGDGKKATMIYTTGDFDAIQIQITPSISNQFSGGIEKMGIQGVYAENGTQVGINFINNSTPGGYPSDCGNSTFRDIYVNSFAIGVKVGAKTGVLTLSDFYIVRCSKYGLEIQGTDNMFNNMNITSCLNGVYNPSGGSNKYSDMKVYWNGMLYNGYTFDYTKTFGMKICGSHSNFSNVEVQENFANGIIFENCYGNTLNGVLADANGNGLVQIPGASQLGDGITFTNCHDFVGNIIADCYHKTPCQVNGIIVNNACHNMSLNYAEYNQINALNASNVANLDIRTPASK